MGAGFAGHLTSREPPAPASRATESPLVIARYGPALVLQVDDHVRDRKRKPLARPFDHVTLEPVRAARGMRRDDRLLGGEKPQRVFHGLDRVGVADVTLDRDAF